jgi:hypothetical protein
MNKAYKVSHILDDVLEAYDDEMGIDPDSYYVVNDGEIIDGPFDTEDEANDASENDDDEIMTGEDYLANYGDEEGEYEEDYDIYEEEGGEKRGRGRPRKDGCGLKQRKSKTRGCYDPGTVPRGRPRRDGGGAGAAADRKAYKAKKARTPRAATMESLASSIIRKINSF